MNDDKFFTQNNCDRCYSSLSGQARKMSWFTEECLCETCSNKEKELRNKLESKGINTSNLEGCGQMPTE
jgi:hypothetical protein